MSGSSFSRTASIAFMLGIVVAGCGHESREQPAQPTAPEVTTTAAQNVLTNSIGMKLILVPAGEFMMGGRESPDELIRAFGREAVNPSYAPAEHPLHRVRITRPFYIGAHEVTKGQFRQFVQATGYKTEAERNGTGAIGMDPKTGKAAIKPEYNWQSVGFAQTDDHPVVNVSWNDAAAFCQWLGRKEGKECRLPTEAQWEYACQAGTTTRYSSGDDPESLAQVANVADAAFLAKYSPGQLPKQVRLTHSGRDGYVYTAPVGQFRPNAFGLYDMVGNVSEWCADWYGDDYYAASPAEDPPGPQTGWSRAVRGGAWTAGTFESRSAARFALIPANADCLCGFRVAMTVNNLPATGPGKTGCDAKEDRQNTGCR